MPPSRAGGPRSTLDPRVPSAGGRPDFAAAFKAEFWIWGYALAAAVLALTLNVIAFYAILGGGIAALWLAGKWR